MKTMTNNKGFSLIELMVVVAIIGILSAIAIPNFQRFQMRSRQSEAKSQLAAIFQVEKAFSQEWSQYFGDWRDIGYAPDGTLRYFITTTTGTGIASPSNASGYMGPVGPANNAAFTNSNAYCGAGAVANFSVCTADGDYVNAAVIGAANAAALTATAFRASATSDLDRGADGTYDRWTIDQTKNLQNEINDTAD